MYEGENIVPEKRLSTEIDPSFPSSSIHTKERPEYVMNSMCEVPGSPMSPNGPVFSSSIKLKKAISTE